MLSCNFQGQIHQKSRGHLGDTTVILTISTGQWFLTSRTNWEIPENQDRNPDSRDQNKAIFQMYFTR